MQVKTCIQVKTWTKEEGIIYQEFFAVLGQQAGWTGEVKITETETETETEMQKSVTIVAGSIIPLKEFLQGMKYSMEYDDVERLIFQLGLQMMVLGTYKKGILFLNLEDILVVDGKFFLLRSLQHVLDIQQKDMLMLTYPLTFKKDDERFLAPELKRMNKVLPFYASVTAGYYSLAQICMAGLALPALQGDEKLDPIKGSKMYFFLRRCLADNPAERFFLYL